MRVARTEERWFAAEILRLEGEANMTLGQHGHAQAEACFKRALAIAESQEARLWELRTTSSLSRIRGDSDVCERLASLRASLQEANQSADIDSATSAG
jgi:hypothetical protein